MTAINFMKRFADEVENSVKCQTIRLKRKSPIKSGDTLQLYTGQRTAACRKLMDAICSDVLDIEVHDHYIMIESKTLSPDEADDLAIADGFADRHGMIRFFEEQYGLPFYGVLIKWSQKP